MLFASYAFIAFFLILLALYYLLPKKTQPALLFCASCFFYLAAGVFACVCVLVCALLTFWIARRFGRGKKQTVVLSVVVNLGVLTLTRCAHLTNDAWIVPLGVSFYALQAIGYAVDVYRGAIEKETRPLPFLSFMTFFPLALQGPIARYGDLRASLSAPHDFDPVSVRDGALRLSFGYLKKLVVADRLRVALIPLTASPQTYRGGYVALVMLFYAIQLYADFTGGIDIAIGAARMLGVTLPENFRKPYGAKTLAEFWNRWHISMGTWFRDYVFYPLSTSDAMSKIARLPRKRFPSLSRALPVVLTTLAVWALTGLWHGFGLSYLVWGLLNGVVLLFSRFAARRAPHAQPLAQSFPALAVCRTLLIVSALRLLDCYRDVSLAFRMLVSLFDVSAWRAFILAPLPVSGFTLLDGVVVFLSVVLIAFSDRIRNAIGDKRAPQSAALICLLFATLIFGVYGFGYDAAQFIYTRF